MNNQKGLNALRQAIRYKLLSWDASVEAEEALERELDTASVAFEDLCASLSSPDEAMRLSDERLEELLSAMEGRVHTR